MEHTNTPEQRRVVSYADAVKGGRKAQAEKARLNVPGDDKVEAAPATQKPQSPAQPETPNSPGPAEALKAAHKAAQQEPTTSDTKGEQVATQKRPAQAKQAAGGREQKSAQRDTTSTQGREQPTQPKTQEPVKPSATASLSYAAAVKGMRSLTSREPKGTGQTEATNEKPSQPGNEQPSAEKHDVAEPAHAESPKGKARQGEESHHPEADQSPLKEAEQDPSKEQTPPLSSMPLISNNNESGRGRSDDPVTPAMGLVRTAEDDRVSVYNPTAPPFSAGAVSSPLLRLPPNAFSSPRASPPPYLPISQYVSNNVPTNIVRLSEHINHARLRELIAAHDRGEFSLWYTQEEWDVEILCQGMFWRVHRQILCRDSDWFRDRLAPILANVNHSTVRVRISMDDHQPVQLGQVLYYIYNHTFQGGQTAVDGDRPMGEPIRRAIFSCIAAASIGCWRMYEGALFDLDCAIYVLPGALQSYDPQLDISHIHEPLFLALQMLYEQGPRPELFRLRIKIAHLLDVTLLVLLRNDSFRLAFADKWVPRLYGHMAAEHRFFQHQGSLPVPPQEPQQHRARRWGRRSQQVGVGDRLLRYQDFVSLGSNYYYNYDYNNNHRNSNPETATATETEKTETTTTTEIKIPDEIMFALCAADSAVRTHDATLASMRRHIEIGHQFAAERDAAQRRGAQLVHLRRAAGLLHQNPQPHQHQHQHQQPPRYPHPHPHHDDHHEEEEEEHRFGQLNADFDWTLDRTEGGRRAIPGPSASGRAGVGAVIRDGGEEGEVDEEEEECQTAMIDRPLEARRSSSPSPPPPPTTAVVSSSPCTSMRPVATAMATDTDTAASVGGGQHEGIRSGSGSSEPRERRRLDDDDDDSADSPGGKRSPRSLSAPEGRSCGGGGGEPSPSCDSTMLAATALSSASFRRAEEDGDGVGDGDEDGSGQEYPPPATTTTTTTTTLRSWWDTVMGEEGARSPWSWWDAVMSWARDEQG